MNKLFQILESLSPNLLFPYDVKSFFAMKVNNVVEETDEQKGERYLQEAIRLLEEINRKQFGNDLENNKKIGIATNLLEESERFDNVYASCLLGIIVRKNTTGLNKAEQITEFEIRDIQKVENKTILQQEQLNWYMLSIYAEKRSISMDKLILGARKGNKYAKGELGRVLFKKGDDIEGALHLLAESHFAGYIESTYILAEYYYKKGDDRYIGFLETGCKQNHEGSMYIKAEILWGKGNTKASLEILRVLAHKMGYKKAIDFLILFTQDENERKQLFEKFLQYYEGTELLTDAFDYGSIRANKQLTVKGKNIGDIVYSIELDYFFDRVKSLYGAGIKLATIEETLPNIYFQQNLESSSGRRPLGIHYRADGKIVIDAYVHMNALYFRAPTIAPHRSILVHEMIHRISHQNSTRFSIPRFLNEGITSLIEEEITEISSLGYPQEKRIAGKLLEYFAGERKTLFRNFLSGNTWVIEGLLKQNIGRLIDFFSQEDGFEEIVGEMQKYQTSPISPSSQLSNQVL